MTCANKGRLMLGSFCEKDEQKECVVIEADLHLLSFTFSAIHDHMLVSVCVLGSTLYETEHTNVVIS
jgi:hypothetical protein